MFDTLLNIHDLVGYYETAHSQGWNYLGETLFPARKKYGLTMSHLLEESPGIGIKALRQSHFDTVPMLRDRKADLQSIQHRMPFFREQMSIGEEDRQELAMFYQAQNDTLVRQKVNDVYDDAATLIGGSKTSIERMRMQILSRGMIDLQNASGLDLQVEYGFDPATQTTNLYAGAQWKNHATSTPLDDLREAKRAARINGTAVAYLTEDLFLDLMASQSVIKTVYVNPPVGTIYDVSPIVNFIQTKLGISLIVVDAVTSTGEPIVASYLDETDNEQSFWAEGVVALWPLGTLGTTWFGTTPEEIDLMNKTERSTEISIVNTGVAVVLHTDPGPPVKTTTSVSMICLPSAPKIKMAHMLRVNAGDTPPGP